MKLKKTFVLFLLSCQLLTVVFATKSSDLYNEGAALMRIQGMKAIEQAIILFEESIKIDSEFIPGYQAIINALIIQFESSNVKEPAILNRALGLTETILKINPGNAKAYFSRATIYFDLKDEIKGYRELKKAIWADPADMDINLTFFYYLLNTAKYSEALRFIKRSKKHFLKKAEIFLIYADGLLQHSLIKEAKQNIAQALKIAPESHKIIITVANLLKQAGDYENAIINYKKAIDLDVQDNFIYFNLAFCYAGIKDYKNAVTTAKKFTNLEPDHIGAKNNLAIYLEEFGLTDEANKIWNQIKNNPAASDIYKNRASQHLKNQLPSKE